MCPAIGCEGSNLECCMCLRERSPMISIQPVPFMGSLHDAPQSCHADEASTCPSFASESQPTLNAVWANPGTAAQIKCTGTGNALRRFRRSTPAASAQQLPHSSKRASDAAPTAMLELRPPAGVSPARVGEVAATQGQGRGAGYADGEWQQQTDSTATLCGSPSPYAGSAMPDDNNLAIAESWPAALSAGREHLGPNMPSGPRDKDSPRLAHTQSATHGLNCSPGRACLTSQPGQSHSDLTSQHASLSNGVSGSGPSNSSLVISAQAIAMQPSLHTSHPPAHPAPNLPAQHYGKDQPMGLYDKLDASQSTNAIENTKLAIGPGPQRPAWQGSTAPGRQESRFAAQQTSYRSSSHLPVSRSHSSCLPPSGNRPLQLQAQHWSKSSDHLGSEGSAGKESSTYRTSPMLLGCLPLALLSAWVVADISDFRQFLQYVLQVNTWQLQACHLSHTFMSTATFPVYDDEGNKLIS